MGLGVAGSIAAAGVAASAAGTVAQLASSKGGASAANAAQTAGNEQARADLQPWVTAGSNALGITGDLSGANGVDASNAALANYQTSPGYQWQLGEGLRAVDAGAAAKGMLRSGATLKGEEAYGQGLASQDFGQYYDRLSKLSGLGQASAAGQAAGTQATAAGIASTDASAATQQASIYGNGAKNIANAFNTYGNNSLYNGSGNGAGLGTSSDLYTGGATW